MITSKQHKLFHNLKVVATHIEQSLLKIKLMEETKKNLGLLRIKSSDTIDRIIAANILAQERQLVLDISYEDLNGEMIYEYVLKGDL